MTTDKKAERLWSYKRFAKHLGISLWDTLQLFESAGLRSAEKVPTQLAKLLELAVQKTTEDKYHGGGEIVWFLWRSERTLRFIQKQPGTAAILDAAVAAARKRGMSSKQARRLAYETGLESLREAIGPDTLQWMGINVKSIDYGIAIPEKRTPAGLALSFLLREIGFCQFESWGALLEPFGDMDDTSEPLAEAAFLLKQGCLVNYFGFSEETNARVSKQAAEMAEAFRVLAKRAKLSKHLQHLETACTDSFEARMAEIVADSTRLHKRLYRKRRRKTKPQNPDTISPP